MAAYWHGPLLRFVGSSIEDLVGTLANSLSRDGFGSLRSDSIESWRVSLPMLQRGLAYTPDCYVFLEFVLPRIGRRADCVLHFGDRLVVVEQKRGNSADRSAALAQAQSYACDLSDFHSGSHNCLIVPIAAGSFGVQGVQVRSDGIICSEEAISEAVGAALTLPPKEMPLCPTEWDQAIYNPVPTIIDAATQLYLGNSVREIAHSRASGDSIETTSRAIANIVNESLNSNKHAIVFVTGVPGAGKTLVGLNSAAAMCREYSNEGIHATFLSGNGPLVAVMREALYLNCRDKNSGCSAKEQRRQIELFVQDMHLFVRSVWGNKHPTYDHVIVFDEAQRAWTAKKNEKKFSRPKSEPEIVLEAMKRHDWCTIVCLVGGGQEIHPGEAGLGEWGKALESVQGYEVFCSPQSIEKDAFYRGPRLFESKPQGVQMNADLHLSVTARSIDSSLTSRWAEYFLAGELSSAAAIVSTSPNWPILFTRDLGVARQWLNTMAIGHYRCGLAASSGAARLRLHGLETPVFNFLKCVDYKKWFLNEKGDYRSSYQLEVAMSEFELQGLELDYVGLCWGGDLVVSNSQVNTRKLTSLQWKKLAGPKQATADDPYTKIVNKYRVLLTRFRKGMIIFVPQGDVADQTTSPQEMDTVANSLRAAGIQEIS